MIQKYGIICGLLLWGWGSLFGQSVIVRSQNLSYSRKPIHITIAWNPFITIPQYTETVVCSEDGLFEHTFEVEIGRVVQFEFGVYQTYLYVEPGYQYDVKLPDFQEKKYSDLISPFFQPVVAPLKVLSRTSLLTQSKVDGTMDVNHRIARFDTLFAWENESVIMSRRLGAKIDIDSIIRNIESEFTGDSSIFFNNYRKHRYGVLKLNEGKTGLEPICKEHLGLVINESNPGFIELFRAMFKDFLFHYARTPNGKNLRYHINRTHHLDSVRHAIRLHPAVWNDTLADMILIQELAGLFYSADYHKEAILILLDSLVHDPVSPDFSNYAAQVREKLSSLLIGHPPPRISLPDLEGNPWTPDVNEGKYIYLMFCSPDFYGCMMEYPFLQSYHLKHSEYLDVVTVMVAKEKVEVSDFMQRNGYGWKALYYEDQPNILTDYLIKAFPTAFLIGPDGNLVLSPATLPSDGFEQQLFRIMRSRGEI